MNTLLMTACIAAYGMSQTPAQPPVQPPGQPRTTERELPLPLDQKFLVKAVECTIAEVKFAETAIEKTSNPEVKQLAETIKNDHNECLKKIMAQAEKHQLGVVQGLSKEDKETANRLSELESNEFDREYVRGVIDRHEKMTKYSNEQIKNGKEQEITVMCKEAKEKVKGHLDAARKVQANLAK